MTTPEAPAPRSLEFKASPVPAFDGNNAIEVQSAFVRNLNIVSGGEVETDEGPIQTPGILGLAASKINTRLEDITKAGEALAADKGQFGGSFLSGPRAVRQIELELRKASHGDNRAVAEARRRISDQQRRIKEACKEHGITEDVRAKYDHMIAVEEYLDANLGTEDLTPIRANLEALKWTRRTPTKERIEDLLDGALTSAPGYDYYKTLQIGQHKEGAVSVKGLKDYKVELTAAEQQQQQHRENLVAKLEETRVKAKDWEERNATFKANDTPEQRKLKTNHVLIARVETYLRDHYVPDAERLAKVSTDLSEATTKLAQAKSHLEGLGTLFGGGIIKAGLGALGHRGISNLEASIKNLETQRDELLNPAKRLTGEGTPRELKDAVKRVTAADFNPDAPKGVITQTVLVLLGKGAVTVDEKIAAADIVVEEGEAVVATAPAPAPAEVSPQPPATGPWTTIVPGATEGTTIDFATASVEDLLNVASRLSQEELSKIPPVKLAEVAVRGGLTVEQLRNLPPNNESDRINETLLTTYKDVIKTTLETSVKGYKEKGKGMNPEKDLPNLILAALRRASELSAIDETLRNRPVSLEDLRNIAVNNSPNPEQDEAVNLVSLASLANQVMHSS